MGIFDFFLKKSHVEITNDGLNVTYYKNNKIKIVKERYYSINGQKHGEYKSYYLDGIIEKECNYINGKFEGIYKSYYKNGQIIEHCNFINGKIEGSYKSYYVNGQIKKDCNYIKSINSNRKLDGIYKSYYENGNLKDQLHYKNGNKVGQFHSFYDNKAKYREGNFGGKEVVKEYFKNGNLKFLKENNKYTFYDEDNNLKCETHIKGYDDFIGTWKNYKEDGTIEYELDFDDTNSDVKNNIVSKTIYTKGGDFYSKNTVSYENIRGSYVFFYCGYSDARREGGWFSKPNTLIGPPISNAFDINLKPISSIEDILTLRTGNVTGSKITPLDPRGQ